MREKLAGSWLSTLTSQHLQVCVSCWPLSRTPRSVNHEPPARLLFHRYWKCALCGHMSRFTQELSRYRKKNAFQTLPELAQEVGVRAPPLRRACFDCLAPLSCK